MSTEIITQIIEECIELDATFTRFDILAEALERSCCIDEYKLDDIIDKFKYPLYYKRSEIRKNGILFNVMHPSDRYAESYDVPDINALHITNTNTFKRPLTIDKQYTINVPKFVSDKNIKIKIEQTLPSIKNKENYQLIEDIIGIPRQPLFDKRGRYSIPTADIKLAELKAGDVVYIIIGMGYITISTEVPYDFTTDSDNICTADFGNSDIIGIYGTHTIDRYGNLQIKNKLLFAAINAIPVNYGGYSNTITTLSAVNVQSIPSAKTINLYPQV